MPLLPLALKPLPDLSDDAGRFGSFPFFARPLRGGVAQLWRHGWRRAGAPTPPWLQREVRPASTPLPVAFKTVLVDDLPLELTQSVRQGIVGAVTILSTARPDALEPTPPRSEEGPEAPPAAPLERDSSR